MLHQTQCWLLAEGLYWKKHEMAPRFGKYGNIEHVKNKFPDRASSKKGFESNSSNVSLALEDDDIL